MKVKHEQICNCHSCGIGHLNTRALIILVSAILIAGLTAGLLPDYLDERQRERDASLDCQLYRVDVNLYGRGSAEAERTRKRGGCSPI